MTPMKPLDLEKIKEMPIEYLAGDAQVLARLPQQEPWVPFDDRTLAFLNALSAALRRNPQTRQMPDAASFAFWCRQGNMQQLKKKYAQPDRIGRGITVHFAPSNIPVLFAFTLVSGLLSGSCTVVRLARKKSPQEALICAAIRQLTEGEFRELRPRIVLCRYAHSSEITDMLSSVCDVRVLWGSDESVLAIRKSPLPPRGFDMPFAARGSAAVIRAKSVLESDSVDILARNFYNDTYLNDQNACSSPVMIGWLGEPDEVQAAQKIFWSEMEKLLAARNYTVPAELAVRKLNAAYVLAAVCGAEKIIRHDSRLIRVQVPAFCEDMWEHTVPGGFFIECAGTDLSMMCPVLGSRCQTVCRIGVEAQEIAAMTAAQGLRGVDRIVPAGHTLDYALTWDGFNMIEMMSRKISCE